MGQFPGLNTDNQKEEVSESETDRQTRHRKVRDGLKQLHWSKVDLSKEDKSFVVLEGGYCGFPIAPFLLYEIVCVCFLMLSNFL